MLVALLLPAVLATQRIGSPRQCANNMKNLAHAMTTYDSAKGRLPGYSQPIRRGTDASSRSQAP